MATVLGVWPGQRCKESGREWGKPVGWGGGAGCIPGRLPGGGAVVVIDRQEMDAKCKEKKPLTTVTAKVKARPFGAVDLCPSGGHRARIVVLWGRCKAQMEVTLAQRGGKAPSHCPWPAKRSGEVRGSWPVQLQLCPHPGQLCDR
jgi:hypothetical protein